MARKDQVSSKKNICDICGAALDDDAVIEEFPDGSLVKLCQDCAEGAVGGDEEDVGGDFGAEDATAEWDGLADEQPAAADLFSEPPARKGTRGADAEYVIDSGDPETSAAKAEAELAAWASAPSTDAEIEEEQVDFESAADQQEAEEAAFELVTAIVEADLADTARFQAVPGGAPETAVTPEIEVAPETPAAREIEAGPEIEVAGVEAEAEVEPAAAEPEPAAAEPLAETSVEGQASSDVEAAAELIDKTKELLMPVTDLITLQNEMQSALARLSSTLEHFVTEMVATEDKTALITSRLQQLEDELDSTRERLRATEALLPESVVNAVEAAAVETAATEPAEDVGFAPPTPAAPPAAPTAAPPPKTGKTQAAAIVIPPMPGAAAPASALAPPPLPGKAAGMGAIVPGTPPPMPGAAAPSAVLAPPPLPPKAAGAPAGATPPRLPSAVTTAGAASGAAVAAAAGMAAAVPPPMPMPPMPMPHAALPSLPLAGAAAAVQKLLRSRKPPHAPDPEPEPVEAEPENPALTFSINEVQVAQRYFNESEFVKKIMDISRSIGKPKANVARASEGAPQAAVTLFWDIVWYQYLVDLRKELPAGGKRVILCREGMDLEELEPRFRDKNATINEDGRMDASELEVRLLSDPSALITEMREDIEEARFVEDATEEIWDQQSAPDFRWD